MILLDLTAAFDSVKINQIWKILEEDYQLS